MIFLNEIGQKNINLKKQIIKDCILQFPHYYKKFVKSWVTEKNYFY